MYDGDMLEASKLQQRRPPWDFAVRNVVGDEAILLCLNQPPDQATFLLAKLHFLIIDQSPSECDFVEWIDEWPEAAISSRCSGPGFIPFAEVA